MHAGVNMILKTLWNAELWGAYQTLEISQTYNESCCRWDNYTSRLSPFIRNRTGPSWRNPVDPADPVRGNPEPCVWCQFDGAYSCKERNERVTCCSTVVHATCAERIVWLYSQFTFLPPMRSFVFEPTQIGPALFSGSNTKERGSEN